MNNGGTSHHSVYILIKKKKTVARNLRESIKEFWKNCGFLKERLLHDRN